MKIRRAMVAAFVTALLVPVMAGAQSNSDDLKALRQDIESLKAGIGAVQKDVQDIKTLLQSLRQPAAPPSPVAPESMEMSVGRAYSRGGADARVVLVEFSDFQCPYCGRHAKQTLPQIERDYVATGKIRYIMRNLPLEQIHPDAFRAAEAAECAGDQGKYWQMHAKLFGNQQALSAADVTRYAQEAGVEPGSFKQCFDSDAHADKIRQDLNDALAAGVNSTPTFFLGFPDGDGKVKIVRKIQGAHPYPVFKATIDGLLAEAANKK